MIHRLEFSPIRGPFTLEHLREADVWVADLLAWYRGERSDPPAGLTPMYSPLPSFEV